MPEVAFSVRLTNKYRGPVTAYVTYTDGSGNAQTHIELVAGDQAWMKEFTLDGSEPVCIVARYGLESTDEMLYARTFDASQDSSTSITLGWFYSYSTLIAMVLFGLFTLFLLLIIVWLASTRRPPSAPAAGVVTRPSPTRFEL